MDFEGIPKMTFFLQLNVVGLLSCTHECNRPSLLDFLFLDPPLPAAIIIVIIVIVIIVVNPVFPTSQLDKIVASAEL